MRVHDIHVTGRGQFKSCRRKYLLGNVLKYRPVGAKNFALAVGTAFHHGMQVYYSARSEKTKFSDAYQAGRQAMLGRWAEEIPPELDIPGVREKREESTRLLEAMYENYTQWLYDTDPWQEVIAVEHTMRASLHQTARMRFDLVGTADLIVRFQGKLWIVDHKTAQGFRDDESILLDDQMTAYIWLGETTFNERFGGACYSQVRKKIPLEPQPLKDGSRLSRQIKDTTYVAYLTAIKKYGFDPVDYRDILEDLKHNDFCRRTFSPRYQARLDEFLRYLPAEASDIIRCLRTPHAFRSSLFYPRPTWDCARYCDFYLLCQIINEGGDPAVALDQNYVRDLDVPEPYRR